MTHDQFISIFTKHLHVAEPRRREILAETKTHLDQGNTLGNPRVVAQELNRVHLGLLNSPFRLGLLITATVIFVLSAGVLAETSMGLWSRRLPPDDVWTNMMYFYSFFAPTVVAVIIGRAVGRMHQARKAFFSLWLLTLVLTTLSGISHNLIIGAGDLDIPDTFVMTLWSSIFSALFLTTVYVAAAFVGLVTHAEPLSDPLGKTRQWQASFTAICLTLFLFFVAITTYTAFVFQPIPHFTLWPIILFVLVTVWGTVKKVRRAYSVR